MTGTSLRFIFINMTTVSMLREPWTYSIAVHIPQGSVTSRQVKTITYPLPKPGEESNGHSGPTTGPSSAAVSTRDQMATRTFAILKPEQGENIWNLGARKNWESVMGYNFDWLLPIRQSPCALHESMESDYEVGPLLEVLKARCGLQQVPEADKNDVELRDLGRHRR
jgi:palmitoyltransferase